MRAFDVRPTVADQIKSLGGEFLTVEIQESGEGQGGYAKEMSKEFIDAEHGAAPQAGRRRRHRGSTTALILGVRRRSWWLTGSMVEPTKPGSVIVDLAAEQGGNCELTKPGEEIVHKGVTVLGFTDLPSRMAHVASDLYGTNRAGHLARGAGRARPRREDRIHDNDAGPARARAR